MMKYELLVENSSPTDDVFDRHARLIILERDEDGCAQIVNIFECHIRGARDAEHLASYATHYDDLEIKGNYDFGKASKLKSKIAKAIMQEMEK